MKTRRLIAAAGTALALSVAPSAFGQDYCVPGCSGSGLPETSLEDALAAAQANPGADRVLLAAGTYTAPGTDGYSAYGDPVEIIGAGAGSTVLTGPTNTSTVLSLPIAGSRVADLRIHIPIDSTNGTKTGLTGNGVSADGIEITAAPGISSVTTGAGLWGGSKLEHSDISLPLDGAFSVGANLGSTSSARDSSFSANRGLALLDGGASAVRDRIKATVTGVAVMSNGEIVDSLIDVADGGIGVYVSTAYGIDVNALVRNSTLVGRGAGSEGVTAVSNNVHTATAAVDSTIISGFNSALVRTAPAGAADLSVAYSDFDPSTILDAGGAGSVAFGAGNIDADPLFTSASDFHLGPGSPAVDAGNPADLGDPEDLGRDARVVDGDADGTARRDMGAFELQPPPLAPAGGATGGGEESSPAPASAGGSEPAAPVVGALPTTSSEGDRAAAAGGDRIAPAINGLRIDRKRRLRFSVSEQALLHVVVKRRDGAGRMRGVASLDRAFLPGTRRLAIGRIRGKALRPGTYAATVTASDAARNRSAAQVIRFRIA